ncbi:MAG: nuclear transport factor 2 family protein [Bradyrhizobium sp.]|uniref:nuclear transport factor 2 family protein n=1 Tax=Bradyrhizobium sp. TaxID=376 RepID=UPI001C291B90|nr:nuclear transport factor 2 family protein [Bradyrhizobium sp.]MBU6461925.1 nuclear transport factor 2 family protein [Pseudomonadota bacterium]MDE2066902.1 nuclear transport factor 2 family protein [Bradyrhizobium sp.]MDE2241271.1 nuclear transport factor 2 family protein [Bradyrhizobium sp.]MDE2470105.1 nuclear transport factor 2 family protein [Bradyrhizobium sp.]
MAVVVDWLDACRNQDVEGLLDCYADDAALECACASITLSGHDRLAAYWKPKLDGFAPKAFGLEKISPHGDGVLLDYLNFEGKPARVVFNFDASGRIAHMRCEPAR